MNGRERSAERNAQVTHDDDDNNNTRQQQRKEKASPGKAGVLARCQHCPTTHPSQGELPSFSPTPPSRGHARELKEMAFLQFLSLVSLATVQHLEAS